MIVIPPVPVLEYVVAPSPDQLALSTNVPAVELVNATVLPEAILFPEPLIVSVGEAWSITTVRLSFAVMVPENVGLAPEAADRMVFVPPVPRTVMELVKVSEFPASKVAVEVPVEPKLIAIVPIAVATVLALSVPSLMLSVEESPVLAPVRINVPVPALVRLVAAPVSKEPMVLAAVLLTVITPVAPRLIVPPVMVTAPTPEANVRLPAAFVPVTVMVPVLVVAATIFKSSDVVGLAI